MTTGTRDGSSGAGTPSEGSPGDATADGDLPAVGGAPAAKRSLRTQGRRTMRRLLDAAMKAIDERGYHGTRVQDVVDLANTSHGTFYLYFSNKEDLVRALTIEATSEATGLTSAVTEAGSALDIESWDHLRQWVADYSALWERYAPLFRSWTDLAAIDEGVAQQIRTMVLAHVEAMASRIRASGGAPDIDPEVAGMAVVAMLDRFHFLREFVDEPVDEATLDSLTTFVYRAIFPTGPGRPGGPGGAGGKRDGKKGVRAGGKGDAPAAAKKGGTKDGRTDR